MRKPELKPGMPLDIVFENELNKKGAHHMKAVIYDCHQNVVTMSQTHPVLTPDFLNRRIFITFLVNSENRVLRFGFPAKLTELVIQYPLSEGNTVPALLAQKTGDPEPTDFRMYFRVKPPSDSDVCVFMEEQKVNLLDISIGGAQFIYPQRNYFHTGQTTECKLLIGTNSFNVGTVIQTVRDPDTNATSRNLQYVSVEFRHDNKEGEIALGRAIMEIERSLLSKGKI